jgi:DNA-binding NarL/FixJ family response regulator
MPEPVTLTVVDDHPVIIAGVRVWCAAADPPIEIVAAGSSAGIAWDGAGRASDVVLFDLHLDNTAPAFGELRRLVDDGRQVIVFAMRDAADAALTCLDMGAFTYLTKAEGEAHLVAAVRAAASDLPYTPPALSGAMGADSRRFRPRLSQREGDVLVEWFQCESKEMVAQQLGLSLRTVNTYLDRVRIKYANAGRPAPTKAALVARAIQDGLVRLDDL